MLIMNIQEFSNTADFKSEIKVEFCKEALFDNEVTSPIISNNVNEGEIKAEYFDVPEFIAREDIVIKNEVQEEDQANKYEDSTTEKGERNYCCDKCNYRTSWKNSLIEHVRIHDKANTSKYSYFDLTCILCQKSFKHKISLDAHYVSRHAGRSDRWGSIITHKINKCPKCLYKTVHTGVFNDHLATHGTPMDQAELRCDVCKYKCRQKSNFIKHLRLHIGKLPFVCTECDKRFNTKTQLDGHILSRHSDNEELVNSVTSKVHQCDKCDFKTVQNDKLKNHLKTCL